jgi:hypothetical protein
LPHPLCVFASSIAPAIQDAKIFPQKPQQIRLSSPSTLEYPPNSHPINHFPPKNSWHSSYAPLDTLNIWIKSIEGQFNRAEINSRRPLAPFFLNQISRAESIFYPQFAVDQSFAGATRAESLFLAHNPYVLNPLAATSTQSIFLPATAHISD